MGTDNVVFIEVLEWFDESGRTLVHRIPEAGSGEIKYGAQLTVRESQAGVFFYQGKAVEAFGPGRHTLLTANIPLLTKMASLPWGLTSPLRAEVYFVNLKIFTNLKWGTRDPVAFKDSELGLIRLRAFGVFNIQVVQPVLFINSLAGTQGIVTTEAVEEYLNRVIVSRFNDYMGETLDTIFNLPARYDQISMGLATRLQNDLSRFGLALTSLYINSITPPQEVQSAIDDRARMGVFQDMDKLMQMKAAMAMEKVATAESAAGPAMGMGMGLMMPAIFTHYFEGLKSPAQTEVPAPGPSCPECGHPVPIQAKFCPSCGHQILVFDKCSSCGENLTPTARFCSRCGHTAGEKPLPKICSKCRHENLSASLFCNECGEKL